MSRSIHAAQGESLPYNHHLHQFLTFLKHERGFADATIVNRKRSLKPFLGWLVAVTKRPVIALRSTGFVGIVFAIVAVSPSVGISAHRLMMVNCFLSALVMRPEPRGAYLSPVGDRELPEIWC